MPAKKGCTHGRRTSGSPPRKCRSKAEKDRLLNKLQERVKLKSARLVQERVRSHQKRKADASAKRKKALKKYSKSSRPMKTSRV